MNEKTVALPVSSVKLQCLAAFVGKLKQSISYFRIVINELILFMKFQNSVNNVNLFWHKCELGWH